MNPLLDFSGLPRFTDIRPEHVAPAIADLLAENRNLIAKLEQETSPSWDNFVSPLTDTNEKLSRAWGIVGHLHSVLDIPEWREAYNASLPEVTRFYTELGQNLKLFEQFKAIRTSREFAKLSPTQARIIDNEIRDFRLSGAELTDDAKPRFKEIQETLAQLGAKFSENLLDATNAHAEWITDEALLSGIPNDDIQTAREAAQKEDRPGWKFTLHAPSYLPVMQYADNRDLRARMYRAYATRASELGKTEWDNSSLIDRILALREEASHLLGYRNYAEVSLVPKMADTAEQVLAFLRELAAKAKPFGERDLAELKAFARTELGIDKLESWDVSYASEKLRQNRYSFSEQEVKQYFPEPKVLEGLFRLVHTLYGLSVEPDSAENWHQDVRFFRILDQSGKLIGQFYLDLYARSTKRGGAWMDEAITRRRLGKGVQTPVAYLNCNFPMPVGDKPALFTHDDVITLFHEFGHGLHHLLTEVDELAVSGIHGVEWDAVELPSQFMENFCWEWDVLRHMTAHVDTGASLPRELFDRMIAAKNFQAGLGMLRQLEFSLFDLLLHSAFKPGEKQSVLDLLDTVRQEVAVFHPPSWNRFPHSFSHIFAGGYAAGYYSYKWAEVLSADAYECFEEQGVLNPKTGASFRCEVLAKGGSRPAIESFRAFRGRDPRVDALLRHNGMTV